jgi:hypothetical protein
MVNYFLTGFAIAVFCMLPPLLSGLSTDANIIWRAPSALGAMVGIAVEIAALIRRRRAAEPAQGFVIAILLSYWPAFLLLIMSALNILVRPGFGPYAGSLTWLFAMAGIDYIVALNILFKMHNVQP